MSDDGSHNAGDNSNGVPASPSPAFEIRSAPTGHLPATQPGGGIGDSVPTQHLPTAQPSPNGGAGGAGSNGGGNSGGSSGGGKDESEWNSAQ